MVDAHDYQVMHQLVDRLSPTQVRRLRLLVTQDEELSRVAQTLPVADSPEAGAVPESLLALIGSVDGPADLCGHHDDCIREQGETSGQRLARGMRGRATTTMSTDELMELLHSE
ncbi:hypothetical protein [Streptacidiphilus sp. EB103A]|uniref:hypothetical protein n=1 Tax=Streptacidiphilus sp. EB103A TaxID=3156275 RepID=UPI0035193EDB